MTAAKQGKITKTIEEARCRFLSWRYNLNGYKRIYHVHIRKTGGTSLNYMFHALIRSEPSGPIFAQLHQIPHHRIIREGLVFVGWNAKLSNRGHYFYSFSHVPLHQLTLPPRTFTVTCFRDPVKRLVSHYNMLMDYKIHSVPHPCMVDEGPWLGASFRDFLQRIPREHLQNQLYMFSPSFKVAEAVERVRGLSHVMFTESFAAGIQELNRKTGLQLQPVHTHKASHKSELSTEDLALLREKLADEYEFLEKVKSLA